MELGARRTARGCGEPNSHVADAAQHAVVQGVGETRRQPGFGISPTSLGRNGSLPAVVWATSNERPLSWSRSCEGERLLPRSLC